MNEPLRSHEFDCFWQVNKANRIQVCNLKIWIKETLLPKARVVVTENVLLFKYQTQATIPALIGEDVLLLLPTALKKSWIYEALPFIVNWDTLPIGNKVSDWEFYWSADHDFYTRLGIWNCRSVWSTDKFVRKLILLRKNENSWEKKTVLLKDFFSGESKSS